MIGAIDAKFGIRGLPVLFAWADTLYNPKRISVPSELIAHEVKHGERQIASELSIEQWWQRYIDDEEFRLAEELEAHVAEFYGVIARIGLGRQARRRAHNHVAVRLAQPLYKWSKLSTKDAKALLRSKGAEY
jgi:hypothetical protein